MDEKDKCPNRDVQEESLVYESDFLLENPVFYISYDGKRAVRRRRIRTLLFVIGNGLLSGFLTLARIGSETPMKYLISCVSLPMELINLAAQIKNLVDKDKPLKIFAIIILTSLVNIAVLVITDIVKWLGLTSGVLATIASSGPFLFAALMTTFALMNTLGIVVGLKEMYQKPQYRTPLKKLAVINKFIRAGGCLALAGLMIPFVFLLTANPFGATLVLGAIGLVALGLVAWKIGKTLIENHYWRKTIAVLGEQDPYQLLGIDKNILEARLTAENEAREHFFGNLKQVLHKKWIQLFGNKEQKKELAFAERSTAASYIQQCYEYTVTPAKIKVDTLEEQLRELQKINAEEEQMDMLRLEILVAKHEYEEQKQHLSQHPRLALLQQVYDLVRKPKGRGLLEETLKQRKSQQEHSVFQVRKRISRQLVEEALQANQYKAIFKHQRGFSTLSPKTSEPHFEDRDERMTISPH